MTEPYKNMQSLENRENPYSWHVPAIPQPVRTEPVHYVDPMTNSIVDNPLASGENIPLERNHPDSLAAGAKAAAGKSYVKFTNALGEEKLVLEFPEIDPSLLNRES